MLPRVKLDHRLLRMSKKQFGKVGVIRIVLSN